MPKITLEIDVQLYRLLQQAARGNGHSLEEECIRRLESEGRRSRHIEALLADLRAQAEPRRSRG